METTTLQAKLSVYVVIALEDDKVKECHVIQDHTEAALLWKELISVYGGGHVCFASRSVNVAIEPSQN